MANAASDFGKQLVTRTPEVAGGLLRSIIEFAINGNTAFPGAKTSAARALQSKGEREAAIDSVVMQHIGLASAQDVLNVPQFGSGAQTLRPIQDLQQGQIRLS